MLMSIFDKSFIHAISADEAAVFDMHFMSNITPLFFIEVLADLEKTNLEEGREALVKSLAGKTPVWASYPNMPHGQIVEMELRGYPIELRQVPIVGGGRRVQTAEGLGTVYDESPEMKAKSRWDRGEFGADEYQVARAWRDALRAAPAETAVLLDGSPYRFTFDDLASIKRHVDRLLDRSGSRYSTLNGALELFGVGRSQRGEIIQRWKRAGGPPLNDFLPYAMHVIAVDLFRILAMASGHISSEKTSNYADLAYLYYLPFCEVFISMDKLHRKCAPLFMSERQAFVWGNDLRPHLAMLVEEYLAHPDIEERGLQGIAKSRRFPRGSFIGDLIRKLRANYQDDERRDYSSRLNAEQEKALVERLSAAKDAPPPAEDYDPQEEDQTMTFTRRVPVRRGRFAFMPKAATDKAEKPER